MSVDTEPRAPRANNTQSSPTFRQTGFAVPTASAPATNDVNAVAVAQHVLSPKMRTSNASLNAALQGKAMVLSKSGIPQDEDSDMTEASQLPLPIPGSFGKLEPVAMSSHVSRSPNDLPTPPDAPAAAPHKVSQSPHSATVRLPSLNSSMLSPRYSTLQGSSISSGPTSITSSNFSPSRSTDPHLYSISAGRKYSYTSFNKPSLSTSFKTSAMRMRGPALDDDEDEEDDSFGRPVLRYARGSTAATDRATAEPGIELDGDEVFSFSSPCFGPKELSDDSVPSPELHEAMPPSQAAANPNAIMSPSWATASLGKLSLNSNEARGSPGSASARRPSRSQHHHSSGALSSSADVAAAAMKQRRYSHNKHTRPAFASPGPSSYTYSSSFGRDHPYARTPTSSSLTPSHRKQSRSRSRSRYDERPARSGTAVDDDETDEEMRMDDDDATEDEADYAYSASYQARVRQGLAQRGDAALGSTPSSFGANASNLGLTFHMSPGNHSTLGKGHPLDASRSPVMSNANVAVSLSRQYSSDRHAAAAGGLAPLRHHPYATSPSATTGPLSASMGLAYSPGSNAPLNRPAHRRGSSLNNGLAAPAYSAGTLSTSPRFGNAAASGRSPEDAGADRLSQSPYGVSSGSPYAAGARGLNGTGGYYGPAQGGAYSQSPRYSQSYGARKESGGYASTLASHFEGHERSDSMASEATEVGDASNASIPSIRKSSFGKAGAVRSTSNTAATGNTEETQQVAAIRDRLGGAASCSAFISKLWHLMINPEQYSKYIRWDEAGTSIILSSEPDIANEFAADVLPRLFKHGNNASFIRQLNLYGFQRIPSSRLLDAAEMKVAAAKRAEMGNGGSSTLNTAVQLYGAHSSFAHPRFLRGREELLPTMKPRSSKKPKKAGARAEAGAGGDETDEEDFALS
ncbi:Heat shock factor (HSF)-type, DNA-binding [Kalmanozyma brasiliensis GHG001]|uniref:Heat shock transcription factor n=1 Tax=Kalmanozyma brasiliensis (strain GHG001) TaxID=1365824 RepID=V5GIJ5_KALBG|nr:Heat shock factor (HSF)-type, DNA-binding [Kalmanozyma brasiliensis GHG001]EST05807.1 Heat shock factor (HSF)-type, DNA-binding [Kalmanozyma brasiliensis GHG001]